MNPPAASPPPVPEERAATHAPCPNCGAPLLGEFCYACGQSKRGLIRHFTSIVGDFVDTVLNIDSRTLRTLRPLYFKPGYLSNEYFAGRRVRYVTPLRLYFFLSIVLFLLISMVSRGEFTAAQLRLDPTRRAPLLQQGTSWWSSRRRSPAPAR